MKKNNRIWELDFFRGLALSIMVYWHTLYDMNEFFGYDVNYNNDFNHYIGRFAVTLFIFIAGISCSLSRSNLKRGLRLLGLALIISAASYLYNPDFVIKFGIIHFFAASLIMYPVFKKLKPIHLLILGIVIIVLGFFTRRISLSNDILFPFGITSPGFNSSDYYSLIPWLGLFLFGIAAGKTIYFNKKSIFKFTLPENIISKVGRHTLLFYIIHQPVILFLLWTINYIKNY